MTNKVSKKELADLVQANIKAMRIVKGMTQQQLADKAGLKVQAISRIENSPQNLSLSNLDRISKALGCSPAELVDTDEKRPDALRRLNKLNKLHKELLNVIKDATLVWPKKPESK